MNFINKVQAAFDAAKTSKDMIREISKALAANKDKWIDVYFDGKFDGKHGEIQFAMGEALTIVQGVVKDYKVERLSSTPMVNLGLTKK